LLRKLRQKRETQNKDGDYLKYQEGEVVQIDSKGKNYPPFLKDQDELSTFKTYEDMIERADKEESDQQMKIKQNDQQSMSESDDDLTVKKRRSVSAQGILRLIWVVVFIGLIYYMVPVFKHIVSETPNLSVEEGAIDNAVESISETTQVYKDNAVEKIDGIFSEETSLPSNQISEQPALTSEQWLNILSSTHNTKQQKLLEVKNHTESLANGDLTHNRYRLLVKGIERNIQGQYRELESYANTNDPTDVDSVLSVVLEELVELRKLTTTLSSASEKNVINLFNEGVAKQNQLNDTYRITFKNLLTQLGKVYIEEDGKIRF